MCRILRVSLVLASCLLIQQPMAADEGMFGFAEPDHGPLDSKAPSLLWSDPSSLSANVNSVDLTTGQYSESFPLINLPGRGGFGISVTLTYQLADALQAAEPMSQHQGSEFGLGFGIGRRTIFADHGGTAQLDDDKYFLMVDLTSIPLLRADSNRFVPESGQPWIVEPTMGMVQGQECIIGWTIIDESGTI